MLVNWRSENLPLFIDSNMAVQQHNVLLEELISQRALMNHWCRFQCRNPRKGCLSLHFCFFGLSRSNDQVDWPAQYLLYLHQKSCETWWSADMRLHQHSRISWGHHRKVFSRLCWDRQTIEIDKRGPWVGGWMIQSMTSKKCENNLLTLVKTAKSSHKRLSEPISPQKTRSAKCTHEASWGCVFLSTLYHTNLLIIIQSTHWLYILLPDTC